MENIIRDWYWGERVPARQTLPQTQQMQILEREIRALEQRFAAALCEEQAALYALLCERRAEAAAERETAIFTQGVRLGAGLILETMQPERGSSGKTAPGSG